MRKVLLLVLLSLVACGRRATTAASTQEYRRLLAQNADGPEADELRDGLAALEYERACQLHTVLAYKRYLDEFPRSEHSADARARLEALRFNAAKDQASAAGWREFLREHPDGAHQAEARRALEAAELAELGASEDPRALSRLSGSGEAPQLASAASARLDEVAFTQASAQGSLALIRYLREFPAGAHREQAQLELLSRQLDSLLFSGQVMAARELAGRDPLSRKLGDLEARFDRAELEAAARSVSAELARAALPGYYLRSVDDLARSLSAPDPLERWQAAEELAQHITPAALDPLLEALRKARSPLIRQRAFDGIGAVLAALPDRIADHEVAVRLDALFAKAPSSEVHLAIATLLDHRGQLAEAAARYQQAYDPAFPDPVVLRRWARLRLERKQPFSAGIAARHLALWSLQVARAAEAEPPTLAQARELCAAVELSRFAASVLAEVRAATTEFPEDVVQFATTAEQARRLSEARLADAERTLRAQDPHLLSCEDRRVADRLEAAVAARHRALDELPRRAPKQARVLLELASQRDPDPGLRTRARALLATLTSR